VYARACGSTTSPGSWYPIKKKCPSVTCEQRRSIQYRELTNIGERNFDDNVCVPRKFSETLRLYCHETKDVRLSIFLTRSGSRRKTQSQKTSVTSKFPVGRLEEAPPYWIFRRPSKTHMLRGFSALLFCIRPTWVRDGSTLGTFTPCYQDRGCWL
jgi:hypothetical protein